MTNRFLLFAAVICFFSVVQFGNGYRILGVFPTPTNSHDIVFRGLTLALHKRGHELVVVTTKPINDSSLKNYTEIDISFGYDVIASINFIDNEESLDWITEFRQINSVFTSLTDQILGHPDLRKLYAVDSGEKFDLLLVEMLYWPAIHALAKRFDVPVIGISALSLPTNIQFAIGDPIIPSHEGNWEIGPRISKSPSFWQRLDNFILVWRYLYWYQFSYMPGQNAIARKYFGNDIPNLSDLEKNVSLIFVNQQGPTSFAKPAAPKIISISGFHIPKKSPVLPKDLQKIFDEAKQGVVYMSLGGTGKSSLLPPETINQFIAGFAKLPYKVLWKFEEDVLPGKPKNVHIIKWAPQQAVLAHPNLKVFVYQGGLQSTQEAVHNAVPLVAFPAFGDQEMQVNKMVSLGVALRMDINSVNGDELSKAITTVANDPGYKQRMLDLRSLINDTPQDSLENAVWWTEFVMRHKGAPYLQSTTADVPWYSQQDMDVVAFISVGFTIVFILTFLFVRRLILTIHAFTIKSSNTKTKIN